MQAISYDGECLCINNYTLLSLRNQYAFYECTRTLNCRKEAWPEGDMRKGIVIAVTKAPTAS